MTHHEDPADPRKYRQLAAALRTQITTGEIAAGTPAPTIARLSADHQCTRQTCAKALSILASEGLVIRYPGLGYYVAVGHPRGGHERLAIDGPQVTW